MINPVASILEAPLINIFVNQLLFGDSGEFLGFDENEPTSRSGGRPVAVQQIREARKPGGADFFICYVGVQLRDGVAAKAD
ncbi:phosphoserine phosphatase, chloroplastic [Beta vulgaris subsp. vulgaris]|uniref:phosphoserine phosphatase, chloroplastic n=1 Tax=Beta vulgaris subsp. vulgaris TaxID=3555 RepID=UPI002036DC44|nr:phosphoserine phosphatase, chloroplastic [Beta vulgaris subsp. vulgaris]